MYIDALPACMTARHVNAILTESRRSSMTGVPYLQVTMWLQRMELWSFGRARILKILARPLIFIFLKKELFILAYGFIGFSLSAKEDAATRKRGRTLRMLGLHSAIQRRFLSLSSFYLFIWFILLVLCESVRSPGTRAADSCELPYDCWELNPSPLEDQPVTTEPSLQLLSSSFKDMTSLCSSGWLVTCYSHQAGLN